MRIALIILSLIGGFIFITRYSLPFVILGICCFAYFLCMVFCFCNYLAAIDNISAKINFKQFLSIYIVDPNAWSFSDNWVNYKKDDGTEQIVLFSSFDDYIKYQKFLSKKEKYIVKNMQLENQAELVKSLRKNLNQMQDDIIKETKERLANV